jgi:Hg(II)-responsive transcriptional regulator
MRIGEVADRAGVNVQTLRYYERRGLLREPRRQSSGYRQYPTETVGLVRFIKRAQELGFSLSDVEDLLTLAEGSGGTCSQVRSLAQAKLDELDRRIAGLREMRRSLIHLVKSCSADGPARPCGLLAGLGPNEVSRRRADGRGIPNGMEEVSR